MNFLVGPSVKKNLFLGVPRESGPDEVVLLLVGELSQWVWDPLTFTFCVLLSPHGPLSRVTTTSKAVVPHVLCLQLLASLRPGLGSFFIASLLELFKVLYRNFRIVCNNLGVGFMVYLNRLFHPSFPSAQCVAELP